MTVFKISVISTILGIQTFQAGPVDIKLVNSISGSEHSSTLQLSEDAIKVLDKYPENTVLLDVPIVKMISDQVGLPEPIFCINDSAFLPSPIEYKKYRFITQESENKAISFILCSCQKSGFRHYPTYMQFDFAGVISICCHGEYEVSQGINQLGNGKISISYPLTNSSRCRSSYIPTSFYMPVDENKQYRLFDTALWIARAFAYAYKINNVKPQEYDKLSDQQKAEYLLDFQVRVLPTFQTWIRKMDMNYNICYETPVTPAINLDDDDEGV